MFHIPKIFQQFPELIAAESTRHGGVSEFPFSSLNLGIYSGDKPEAVQENRKRFFEGLGIDLAEVCFSYQIHEDKIWVAQKLENLEGYDAFITHQPNVFVCVTVADCTPVLIYDAKNQAVASIHAGWKGTVLGIAGKSLQKMQEVFGTNPADCYAYIGTCIDECSFEVGDEVANHFGENFKRFDEAKGKFFVDLKQANQQQLTDLGIPKNQIEISEFSTVLNNEDYFSHRKEQGKTGRMLAVIGVRGK
jgi:polyphenol oxidase